jgi:triphosphatase
MPSNTNAGPETELKFDVTPQALRRLAKHPALAGEVAAVTYKATYFDTPGLDLRKQGLSLRVRKEGDRFVQAVKRVRGEDMFARDEWETEVVSANLDLAALDATPVAKALDSDYAALGPIFVSNVTRASRNLAFDADVISVTIDSGKLMAGKATAPVLEMELELKAGEARTLFKLARDLFENAPIRLSLLTKSDRGFALAGVERARAGKASATPLAPEMSVAEAFRRIARSCLVQIVSASEVLQREPTAEGVHQTRIGLRRLRTAMKIFQPAVDDGRTDWIEQEVRWIAGELGDARALDVFLEEGFTPVAGTLSDNRAAARYGDSLNSARLAAYDKALIAVASPRFARLTLEIALWVEDGDWLRSPDREAVLQSPIGPFAADALDRLRTTVRKRGEGLKDLAADRRHKLRIRTKRLRYATQFFEKAFGDVDGKRRRRFVAALKSLQESLGKLNDLATADAAAMRAIANTRAPALAFAAGEIVGRIKVTEPVQVDKAIEAFDDFKDAKRYWPKPQADLKPR